MINNFEALRPLLNFEGDNYIKVLSVQRPKDLRGEDVARVGLLEYLYFGSLDTMEQHLPGLIARADQHLCRLYIDLNPVRPSQEFADSLCERRSLWGLKPLDNPGPDAAPYWLYDADAGREEQSSEVWTSLEGQGLAVTRIPTVTGEHFILRNADYRTAFAESPAELFFHERCLALLYK